MIQNRPKTNVLRLLPLILAAAFTACSWLNLQPVLASLIHAAVLICLAMSLSQILRERREKESIQERFKRLVPDQVVREMIAHPNLLKLGAQRCRLSILFADLNDFTAMSEMIPPEQVVQHLYEYLTAMTEIIQAEGGILDKYEGDRIMAEFGTPLDYPDHARRACQAALRMQSRLRALRCKWRDENKPALFVRIGVNTGEVVVGSVGSDTSFDYTVFGDAVNLSARFVDANKMFGTGILISATTRSELPVEFVTRPLGDLHVRGRSQSAPLFELIAESRDELPSLRLTALEQYKQGWEAYQRQDYSEAENCFAKACFYQPNDLPARILLERCNQLILQPSDVDSEGAELLQQL